MFATDQIGQYLLASLLLAIAGGIGYLLCIIPGLIVVFYSQYFGYFLLDKHMSAVDSIKASFGFVNKNLGTLIGAFIIAVIQNGMNLRGVESYTQKIVLGLVILGSVLLDRLRRRGGR